MILAYYDRDNLRLIETLLDAESFPLKDSYIPFLRHDRRAITRNIHIMNKAARNVTGVPVLNSTDAIMQDFSRKFLGFTRNKGVDFLARFNGKYVVGEAKFLTDFGGHQNAQFEDAISTRGKR